jgi:cytochrome c2
MAANMQFLWLAAGTLFALIPAAFGADAAKGKELFRGCAGCHNYDGDARKSGPSLRTLFGKVTLRNGTRATDENVRALILEGFNRMPSYRYQFRPEEFDDLIAFLKTLNARPGVESKAADQSAVGKELFAAYCGRCHGVDSTNAKSGGSLEGLFRREKLADGKPVNDRNVLVLMEEGHADMTGTRNWLDETATKALLAYVKSL